MNLFSKPPKNADLQTLRKWYESLPAEQRIELEVRQTESKARQTLNQSREQKTLAENEYQDDLQAARMTARWGGLKTNLREHGGKYLLLLCSAGMVLTIAAWLLWYGWLFKAIAIATLATLIARLDGR